MKTADYLITNGQILLCDRAHTHIVNGFITIQDGRITAVDTMDRLDRQITAAETIDAGGKLLMPGLVDTHTHVAMAYFKGLADDLPLDKWLKEFIWPVEGRMLTPDFVYDASLHGIAEMIRNGVTCFNDMYFFGVDTARAALSAGIRCVIGEGVLDMPMAGHTSPEETLAYTVRSQEEFRDSGLVDFAVAPHSIYACGRETLIKCRDTAEAHDLRIHLHLSESKWEVNESFTQHGKSPVAYLDEIGMLGRNTSAAHCVWLDDNDCEILAKRGSGVALCSRSNMKLASGFAPLRKFIDHSVRLSLGTDGVASNNNIDIFAEMGATALVFKGLESDPTFLPARSLVRMATVDGASVMGMQEVIGSLEVGKSADLIMIDLTAPDAMPLYNPDSHLVYALGSNHVTDVFVAGKPLLRNRVLQTICIGEIAEKSLYHAGRIRAELGLV